MIKRGSEIIKRIYSAGEDRSAWDAVLVDLFQLIGCRAGIATLVDLKQKRLHLCRVYGRQLNGFSVDDYAQRYRRDPTFVWVVNNPDSRFCDSRTTMPPHEYQADEFVRWAGEMIGSDFWYSGCAAPANGLSFCLAAHFSEGPEGVSGADPAFFQLLFDHLECALRLGGRPFGPDSARPLLRLDDRGRVEQISRGAELLPRQRSAVCVSNNRLSAADESQQRLLDETLMRLFAKGSAPPNSTAVQIKHEQGRPWIVVFRPVAESYGPFGKIHRKVDVELLDRLPVSAALDVVQSMFDITGRELQVLRLLAHGHSIDSLSATIEVSRNTTRAHLRSIYLKTKTNSQVELMQLCSGLSNVTAHHAN